MSVTEASDTEAVGSRSASSHEPGDTGDHEPLLAPMWRRLVARAVDVTAVATWMFALSVAHVFLHLQLWSRSVAPDPWGTWFLATLTFAVCYAAYEITFISRTGATPGKDLMKVRVIDHLTGRTPSLGQATRRWLLPGIVQPIPGPWFGAALTLVWGGTGFANHHQRGVHDHLAGTRVVMARPLEDKDEEAQRLRQFTPRFIDPLAVFRIARNDPEALRRHPADHES